MTPDGQQWLTVLAEQRTRVLRRVVLHLNDRQLTLVWEHYYEGRSLRQIAYIFGVTESAVNGMHRRVINRLREELAEEKIHGLGDI